MIPTLDSLLNIGFDVLYSAKSAPEEKPYS